MKYSPMKYCKVIIAAAFLTSAVNVSATPFSPSWMKTSVGGKPAVTPPGELDGGGNGLQTRTAFARNVSPLCGCQRLRNR